MQCNYVTAYGQCPKQALTGTNFCKSHAPVGAKLNPIIDQYRITCKLIEESTLRHAQTDNLKSIRGELALARSLLESRLNMVQNEAEMVAAMPSCKDYLALIDKLVSSLHTMDLKLSNLLDKRALVKLA